MEACRIHDERGQLVGIEAVHERDRDRLLVNALRSLLVDDVPVVLCQHRGDPCHGGADDAHLTQQRREIRTTREPTTEQPARGLDVGVAEHRQPFGHVGEPDRAPQAAQLVLVVTGDRGHVGDVVGRAAGKDQPIERQEREPTFTLGARDVVFRSSGLEQKVSQVGSHDRHCPSRALRALADRFASLCADGSTRVGNRASCRGRPARVDVRKTSAGRGRRRAPPPEPSPAHRYRRGRRRRHLGRDRRRVDDRGTAPLLRSRAAGRRSRRRRSLGTQ